MKANEIRVSNAVEFNGRAYYVISIENLGVHGRYDVRLGNDDGVTVADLDKLKPVRLTEEWLERFGFKKSRGHLRTIEVAIWKHPKWQWQLSKHKQDIYDIDHINGDVFLGEFAEVHKLQNLYKALVGEELEIKELV